jgi:hypothetical protein
VYLNREGGKSHGRGVVVTVTILNDDKPYQSGRSHYCPEREDIYKNAVIDDCCNADDNKSIVPIDVSTDREEEVLSD